MEHDIGKDQTTENWEELRRGLKQEAETAKALHDGRMDRMSLAGEYAGPSIGQGVTGLAFGRNEASEGAGYTDGAHIPPNLSGFPTPHRLRARLAHIERERQDILLALSILDQPHGRELIGGVMALRRLGYSL